MDLVNTNDHPVYRVDDDTGARKRVPPGRFEGSRAEAKLPGVEKADSERGEAWLSAHDLGGDEQATDDVLAATSAVDLMGRSMPTARLRDPHVDPGEALGRATQQAQDTRSTLDLSAPPATGEGAEGVPAYGVGAKFAPDAENYADELVVAGDLDAAELRAAQGSGHEGAYTVEDLDEIADGSYVFPDTVDPNRTPSGGIVDPETVQPPPDAPSGPDAEPAAAEGVEFASAKAESLADELGVADQLEAGKGSGQGGAFKTADVKRAAKS